MAYEVDERKKRIFSTHKGYELRVISCYAFVVLMLAVLIAGLAYRQLYRTENYSERERIQNQRRVLIPGPRGNIYDRDGNLLVGNRPRLAVTLYLDELRPEFRREYINIRLRYRKTGDKDIPNSTQMQRIARYTVAARYLETVNNITGRATELDATDLDRNFRQNLLLPYILVDDLTPEEYARLVEQLPPVSPLQLYVSSVRDYPQGSLAAHVLGYVSINDDFEIAEDFPGSDLATFKMKGTAGREGLEKVFDAQLQGGIGGTIYRVDPSGYRINPPLKTLAPTQGENLRATLDTELQQAAERALLKNDTLNGAVVAVDINNGEVLVMATKADYDLTEFVPRLSHKAAAKISEAGAWINRATTGLYPPGSSFKLIPAIAGLRAGTIDPDELVNCSGYYVVAGRRFACHDGHAHGDINLTTAIEKSCNVYFYKKGIETGVERIAAEARRFGLGKQTGIEIAETRSTLVPDPAWKLKRRRGKWFPGDTANLAIGQGDLIVTPLQMALMTASFARNEITTKPTLVRPAGGNLPQRGESTGLTERQYAVMVDALERVTVSGTARIFQRPFMKIPGLRIAGKTGTAQRQTEKGIVNFAWFICYAPVENPRIAIAAMVEGDTPGEETGGGRYAAPIARAILDVWNAKNAEARE